MENTCLQLIAHAVDRDSAMGFINEMELERFILERLVLIESTFCYCKICQ